MKTDELAAEIDKCQILICSLASRKRREALEAIDYTVSSAFRFYSKVKFIRFR
jgi:hypothetical protein